MRASPTSTKLCPPEQRGHITTADTVGTIANVAFTAAAIGVVAFAIGWFWTETPGAF